MAYTWGSYDGPSVSAMALGLDVSISGTTVTVTAANRTKANSVSDNQTITWSGKLSGTSSFYMNTPNDSPQVIASKSFTGSHGSSYAVTVKLSGAYNGATPTHSRTITIPAATPSKPSTPTISAVATTTATATLGSAPSSNGASILEYGWEVEGHSSWTSGTSRTRAFTDLAANTSYRVRVRARNSVGWGPWSDYSAPFTTAPLAPLTSPAPSITRTSDTQHGVSAQVTADTTHPVTSAIIQRRTYSGTWSGWADLHTMTGSWTANAAVTWQDMGTVANGGYEYRLQQTNAASTTTGTESATTYTTPSAPTGLTAGKSGANIVVTATPTHVAGTVSYEWRDNGASVGTTAVPTFTHTSPATDVTHTYTVRVVVAGLLSAWSAASNTVQLQAPPLAPTLTSPASGAYVDAATSVAFKWAHNPVDTTAQTAAEIEIDGTTYTTTTAQTYSRTLTAGAHTWRVRTRGAHATYGPWSALRTVNTAARPVISLTDPSTAISRAILAFTVSQPITSWTATLAAGGATIETITGTTSPATFSTALLDSTTYTATLTVTAQTTGLTSPTVSRTWVTDFPLPVPADVELSWSESDGSVGVNIQPGTATAHTVPATSVDVERSINGAPFEMVASGLDPSSYITDRQAAIGTENRYRVTTWSALPSSNAVTEIVEPMVEPSRVFISGGNGYETVIACELTSFKKTPQIDVEVLSFVGKTKPTALYGDGCSDVISGTAKAATMGDLRAWEALTRAGGPVLFRATDGTRLYGALTSAPATDNSRIDFTIEEADE